MPLEPDARRPPNSRARGRAIRSAVVVVAMIATALLSGLPGTSQAPVSVTVPFSSQPVADGALDGDPATGVWSDAAAASVPLSNGASSPYGEVISYMKHDGTSLYVRIDGWIDVPWTSASGPHFWVGFLLSPAGTAGHHRASQDSLFFGDTSYPGVGIPLVPVDAYGSGKPPSKDASQDAVGRLAYAGTSAPYAFTAEWKRRLATGDANDVALLADGTASYAFAITTDSNGRGSQGGGLDHSVITVDNLLTLQRPPTGDSEPPRVSIVSPENGSEVRGTVPIRVLATDNVGVERVEVYVDDAALGAATSPPYEIPWDTTAVRNGPHRVEAAATDPSGNRGVAWVDVLVANPDTTPPVAAAGPDRQVPPGTLVTLDGTGSSDDQGIVRWIWSFVDDGTVSLEGAVVAYRFDRAGSYLITLTVRDAAGNVGEDDAWVHVVGDAEPPVARAGPDRTVLPGTAVTLDGSGSSDDVGIENYTWAWYEDREMRAYGVTVTHAFAREGSFLVTLTVRDFVGKEASDSLWVNVTVPVEWAGVPSLGVTTTEGGSVQRADVQVSLAEGDLFVRATFPYAGAPADPDRVYFALEFDGSGRGFPMSAGDEMIIVSGEDASGAPLATASFFISEDLGAPSPVLPSAAHVVRYEVEDGRYEVVFYRGLVPADPARQVDLTPGARVRVAFAIGEWGRGSAHAYTLMAWELRIGESEATLVPLDGADLAASYRLAGTLGVGLVVVTVLLVAVHAIRRRVWRRTHPVEAYCGAGEKVEVERHSLGVRAVHWSHVGLMSVFILTGWSILARSSVFGAATVPVHIAASFLILAVDFPVHFYMMRRSGDLPFLAVPRKDDVVVGLSLVANFLGVRREYEEHATVDPETGGWYRGRKYCAFQKALFLTDLAAILAMAVTGYALYWPGAFAWLESVLRPLGGYFAIRGLHLFLFYYFVATLIAHAYLSFIPMNWGKLASMVRGAGEVPSHGPGEAPPEDSGDSSEEPETVVS